MDILELIHMETQHSESRPFRCNWDGCNKAFSRRSDLARHGRIHTNERYETCGVKNFLFLLVLLFVIVIYYKFAAPFEFGSLSKLEIYITISCKNPHDQFEREYVILITCTIYFFYIIRPFTCTESGCGKSFIQRSALTVHMRTHSGERPHVCEHTDCSKTFSDSSSLARHRRIHTGKRPYKCGFDGCGKSFCRKTNLTRHHRHEHILSVKSEKPIVWRPLMSESHVHNPPLSPSSLFSGSGSPSSTPTTPTFNSSYCFSTINQYNYHDSLADHINQKVQLSPPLTSYFPKQPIILSRSPFYHDSHRFQPY
ncbi:hypothetical protein G9A89_021879 [Geosiphon pyriformis]|nr:hypothetical protein G9A89_021879 [Geosiphon pyriformis]